MSWQDCLGLTAITSTDYSNPNFVIKLGRMVNTQIGNAPSGLIFWQPNPPIMPAVMGFICNDKDVGRYFGPQIFAGTPFEHAPILQGSIQVLLDSKSATATCNVGGFRFELEMTDFSTPCLFNRQPEPMTPFHQMGIELSCAKTVLRINDEAVDIIVPPVGMTGGPGSFISPIGMYGR